MLLRVAENEDLIRIEDIEELLNPRTEEVVGRSQAGEEEQERVHYKKSEMTFPSGEQLPRCWRDPQGNRTLVLRWSNDCVDRSVGKSLCEDCEDLGVQANGV